MGANNCVQIIVRFKNRRSLVGNIEIDLNILLQVVLSVLLIKSTIHLTNPTYKLKNRKQDLILALGIFKLSSWNIETFDLILLLSIVIVLSVCLFTIVDHRFK